MVLSLCACGGTSEPEPTPETTPEPLVEIPEETNVIYTYEGEATDLFTIEEIELEPTTVFFADNAEFFIWKMKVRNTSGADLLANESSVRIWYNYLDEKEDVLFGNYETGGYSSTIKDGQAILIDCSGIPGGLNKRQLESIRYIEIYGYTNTLHGSPDYEFTTPIIIDVKERKVIQAPSLDSATTTQDIPSILISNEWVRKAPAGNLITMTLNEDGTGIESYGSDLEDSTIEWEIDGFQTIKMTIHMSNGTAKAEYSLEEVNGEYKLIELSENGHVNINNEEDAWTINK